MDPPPPPPYLHTFLCPTKLQSTHKRIMMSFFLLFCSFKTFFLCFHFDFVIQLGLRVGCRDEEQDEELGGGGWGGRGMMSLLQFKQRLSFQLLWWLQDKQRLNRQNGWGFLRSPAEWALHYGNQGATFLVSSEHLSAFSPNTKAEVENNAVN